ncbi:hypothetical protein ACH5RR_012610 [Cinchona calisaya]|uniref:Uncharacterized protein n=1 Tax=Cinchona calisaya TaxID=153742 RepID=A0ABD3A885_9GENT
MGRREGGWGMMVEEEDSNKGEKREAEREDRCWFQHMGSVLVSMDVSATAARWLELWWYRIVGDCGDSCLVVDLWWWIASGFRVANGGRLQGDTSFRLEKILFFSML